MIEILLRGVLFQCKLVFLGQVTTKRAALVFEGPAVLAIIAPEKVSNMEKAVLVSTIQGSDLQRVVLRIVHGQTGTIAGHHLFQRCTHPTKDLLWCSFDNRYSVHFDYGSISLDASRHSLTSQHAPAKIAGPQFV